MHNKSKKSSIGSKKSSKKSKSSLSPEALKASLSLLNLNESIQDEPNDLNKQASIK
jgi:hypothetical protein